MTETSLNMDNINLEGEIEPQVNKSSSNSSLAQNKMPPKTDSASSGFG